MNAAFVYYFNVNASVSHLNINASHTLILNSDVNAVVRHLNMEYVACHFNVNAAVPFKRER